jgi:hypothetical protein
VHPVPDPLKQSSNTGCFSHHFWLTNTLTILRLMAVLLCTWLHNQRPGPPYSHCKPSLVKFPLRPTIRWPVSWFQAPICDPKLVLYYCQTAACLLMWYALSDKRACLSFTIAADSSALSFSSPSPVRLMTIFYSLRFQTPPTWRAKSPYLYPQEHGCPVLPPSTGFPFRRLLRLARLRWRYWNRLHTGFHDSSFKFQVILRPTVSRPVRLCIYPPPPSGDCGHIFITVGYLLSSFCVAPSLMRGRICNILV